MRNLIVCITLLFLPLHISAKKLRLNNLVEKTIYEYIEGKSKNTNKATFTTAGAIELIKLEISDVQSDKRLGKLKWSEVADYFILHSTIESLELIEKIAKENYKLVVGLNSSIEKYGSTLEIQGAGSSLIGTILFLEHSCGVKVDVKDKDSESSFFLYLKTKTGIKNSCKDLAWVYAANYWRFAKSESQDYSIVLHPISTRKL